MNRTPPAEVIRILREEVVFGCPVPDCGSPYLEWHHFDPPWKVQNHQNPEGMIALCREHHFQADNGAFTKEQLHQYKRDGRDNWKQVSGRFNWMRRRLIAVVGGNYYIETPVIFNYRGDNIIWFERDDNNYLLLNLKLLSTSKEPRAYIVNNVWYNTGGEEDIVCPPSGKYLKLSYPNGDSISIDFFEMITVDDVVKRYPHSDAGKWPDEYPLTIVETTYNMANTDLSFNANNTKFETDNLMTGCFFKKCGSALCI